MAGNTIAKLAVIVTTDTGPMGQGFRTAESIVRGSSSRMESGFSGLADRLKLLKDAGGAAGGSIRDMTGVLRAGPWGLAAAGVASIGVAAWKAAQAADALEMRAVKVADEWETAYKQLTGKDVDIGFNKADTWTGQWERLKEAAVQFFGTLAENRDVLQFFKDMTSSIADILERWTQWMKTPEQKAQDAFLKQKERETAEMKKQYDLQQKMAKEAEAAAKKLADERTRAWEALERTAESITKSLRTPDEIFRDTVTELKNLFQQGLLSDDIFSRGLNKARQDLDAALDRVQGISKATDTRVAAVERFTMAGFSAAQRTQETKRLEELAKKTADNSTKQVEWLQSIGVDVKALAKSGGVLRVTNLQ